jgi:hypothetical protein
MKLLKGAEYAACHERWNLHREYIEEARDLLHDEFPDCFSKHQTSQPIANERAA